MAEDQRTCPGRHSDDRPAPGLRNDEYLCTDCVSRARRQLRSLYADLAELELTELRQTRSADLTGRHRSKGDERPLPFNPKASSTRTDVMKYLRAWAEFAAGLDTLRPSLIGTDADAYASIDALIENVDWLRTHEQGPQLADVIGKLRRQLRSNADRRESRWFAGVCGQKLTVLDVTVTTDGSTLTITEPRVTWCKFELWATPGEAIVTCDGHNAPSGRPLTACGAEHSAVDRNRYTIESARDQWLPLDVILTALPSLIGRSIDRKTVNQWSSRKLISPPRSVPGKRAKVYRAGDIIALAMPKSKRQRRARAARRKADQEIA
jgi:hypothetical protein